MSKPISEAARMMARQRWKGVPAEVHREYGKLGGRPRSPKRCFCGATTMRNAANRNFDCCRQAGLITFARGRLPPSA